MLIMLKDRSQLANRFSPFHLPLYPSYYYHKQLTNHSLHLHSTRLQ